MSRYVEMIYVARALDISVSNDLIAFNSDEGIKRLHMLLPTIQVHRISLNASICSGE